MQLTCTHATSGVPIARPKPTMPQTRTLPATATALLALAVTLLWTAGTGAHPASAANCARAGGPGLIGEEVLLEQGFTTGEMNALGTAIDRFAKKICPYPEFVAILEGTVQQTHIDRDTVWKYTFAIKAAPGRRYRVTCLMPDLDHMGVAIRSNSGKTLYRARFHTGSL
jgi:hypothetical protein